MEFVFVVSMVGVGRDVVLALPGDYLLGEGKFLISVVPGDAGDDKIKASRAKLRAVGP